MCKRKKTKSYVIIKRKVNKLDLLTVKKLIGLYTNRLIN